MRKPSPPPRQYPVYYLGLPPALLSPLLFDLIKRMTLAPVYAGALFARLIPVIRDVKIGIPERPCPALVGPNIVNPAPFFPVYLLQENAVIGRPCLPDRLSRANFQQERKFYLLAGHLKFIGYHFDLRRRYPYIALVRPGAALAAPGTFEMQAAGIPGQLIFFILAQNFILFKFSIATQILMFL